MESVDWPEREEFPNFNLDLSEESQQSVAEKAEEEDLRDGARYGNVEVDQFIEDAKNGNTKKKTNCDIQLLTTFATSVRLDQVREYRKENDIEFHKIPPKKLDKLLSDYFINCRQRDGSEYQPNSLRSQLASFNRWLLQQEYGYSLMDSPEFRTTRAALVSKQKELKGQGAGNLPNRCRALTSEEVELLYEKNLFSLKTPEGLLFSMYWNMCYHCGVRPGQESRSLCWGDVTLQVRESDGKEFLVYNERRTKTRMGCRDARKVNPCIFSTTGDPQDPRDPVSVYKAYSSHRPTLLPDSPFYLSPKRGKLGSLWFSNAPVGKNKLAAMMKEMAAKAGLNVEGQGGRIRNHTMRKSLVKTLKKNNIPDTDIALITGHKNIQSINDYNTLDYDELETVSHTLSGYKSKQNVQIDESSHNAMATMSNKRGPSVYFGTVLGGTFNFGQANAENCTSRQVTKRRRIISPVISESSSQE